jgi:proteasome lid subunit RPN8/RPN11
MRFENDIIFILSKEVIGKINKCIEKSSPNEACGFLFGEIDEIDKQGDFKYIYHSKLIQCIESSITSPVSFSVDNDDQILEISSIMIKNKGLKLIAVFHSHPAGAFPSYIDKKSMKHYHNCGIKKFTHLVWIIVDSRNKNVNGFIYLDNKLTQIRIELSED